MFGDLTNLFLAVNSCNQLLTAVIHVTIAKNSMLEAFYGKTCFANCFGNCLEMNFEYLNVFVAQKLTELRIFGCQGYSRVNLGKL